MGKMTIGQKAERVLRFILGLRNSHVLQVMAAHGFKPQDLEEGWTLLRAATAGKLSAKTPPPPDPSVLASLDAWENRWFPIAVASLRTRFPAIYENLFRNLSQTEGPEVIISVGTFLSRLEELKSTPDGKAAAELLASRGINATVISEAKAMLAKLQTSQDFVFPAPTYSEEENKEREDALWNWYREWGGIARAIVTDRRELKSLGFLDDSGRSVADDTAVAQEEPAAAPIATKTATPATQVDDPGMPGANPFVRK
jgi:hypothetical protein